jgi:hypothetical protein
MTASDVKKVIKTVKTVHSFLVLKMPQEINYLSKNFL